MAAGMSGARSSKRRRSKRHLPMSEINVTPFVDVMLVLLIIFMVTAPLLTVGVQVDLPKTKAGPVNAETKPLTLSVRSTGQIFLEETEISLEEIAPKLTAIAQARENLDTRIFIRGDKLAPYEIIAKVLGRINEAGFTKYTLSNLPNGQ